MIDGELWSLRNIVDIVMIDGDGELWSCGHHEWMSPFNNWLGKKKNRRHRASTKYKIFPRIVLVYGLSSESHEKLTE